MTSYFKRSISKDIEQYLKNKDYKTLFIWGPRRSGKTTLINQLSKKLKCAKYNFDLQSDRDKFAPRKEVLDQIVQANQVILIDEVQNYPEATVMIKLLHDEYQIKVIATGSSELRQKTSQIFDTMAGRFNEIYCLPLSVSEIKDNTKPRADQISEFTTQLANNIQIWGSYPEIYTKRHLPENKRLNLLQSILDTYVLKDVVDIYALKNQKLAKDILTKIALQIGSEVSLRELASSLGANAATVASYIEIFIKNYILIPLPSFKTNLRRAVSENRKLYFYDLGLRNILVQDFRDLSLRPDQGGIFENFVISELVKNCKLNNSKLNLYFYREYGGKEVDLVIEDYYKCYQTVEIKTTKGQANNIFPLKNTSHVATTNNYFDIITHLSHTPSL